MTTTYPSQPAAPGSLPQEGARAVPRRRPWTDGLLLCAVALVVVVVSMPRLSAYVQVSNEGDVPQALAHFAEARERQLERAPAGTQRTPRAVLGDVLARSRALHHRLRDARSTRDGSLVLYHGYLYRLGSDGALYAWPARHGRSGTWAFARLPDGELRVHANAAGRWSGAGATLGRADLERDGWRAPRIR